MPTTEMRCHWCQIHFYDGSVSSDPILSLLPPPFSPPSRPSPSSPPSPPHTHPSSPSHLAFPSPLPSPFYHRGVVWWGVVWSKNVQILLKYKSVWGRFFLFTPSTVICSRNCPPARGRRFFLKNTTAVCEMHEK